MDKTDVLIVGAGPAGSVAAKQIAKAGYAVQVYEEHPTIGLPLACGEGMSQFMLDRFPWAPKEGYRVKNQYLHFPGDYCGFSKINAVSISRPRFDKQLSELAQDEGVSLFTNTSVKNLIRTSQGIKAKTKHGNVISAKIVIAADGPSSRMMQQLNLTPPTEIVQGIEYRVNGLETEGFHFFFDESITPHGYGWIFDKGEGISNVGICLKGGMNPRSHLNKFMKNQKLEGKIEQVIAGIIPSSGHVEQCYDDNFMVVGDAGGFTNPIFFGGIGIAMLTGELSGETAIEALEDDTYSAWKLAAYDQKVKILPITSPSLLLCHDILYHQCNNSDLAQLGVLINDREITYLTNRNKVILFGRILSKPQTWSRLGKILKIVKGFSISRDWGF